MSDFNESVDTLLDIEKGYSNDPDDPGGETNFGITKRSYPYLSIKNLTKENAKKIYLDDFWKYYRLYEIENSETATILLIMLVNMSPVNAIKILQKALLNYGVIIEIDGILGHKTIDSLNTLKSSSLFKNYFTFELIQYYSKIVEDKKSSMKFYRGWIKRALI
jgi:lysozyme family protein